MKEFGVEIIQILIENWKSDRQCDNWKENRLDV